MKTHILDNPRVRAHHLCPICNGPKERGLVACWRCFRQSGLKNGDPAAERKITEREEQLRGVRHVNIGERPVKVEIAPDNPDAMIDATVFLVSVWLGEMLEGREIDGGSFNAMMRELQSWANEARARPAMEGH